MEKRKKRLLCRHNSCYFHCPIQRSGNLDLIKKKILSKSLFIITSTLTLLRVSIHDQKKLKLNDRPETLRVGHSHGGRRRRPWRRCCAKESINIKVGSNTPHAHKQIDCCSGVTQCRHVSYTIGT